LKFHTSHHRGQAKENHHGQTKQKSKPVTETEQTTDEQQTGLTRHLCKKTISVLVRRRERKSSKRANTKRDKRRQQNGIQHLECV
jgi:hypothetical protein